MTQGRFDFGGDEPPAVAALLVHGGQPQKLGLTATIVDLIARGALRYTEARGDHFILHAASTDMSSLLDYEAHLVRLVADKDLGEYGVAVDQVAAAFRGRWLARFNALVVDEARRRGLCEPRFPALGKIAGERLTARGRTKAKWWSSVEHELDRDAPFPSCSITAVTTLERDLAYATAFGVVRCVFGESDSDAGRGFTRGRVAVPAGAASAIGAGFDRALRRLQLGAGSAGVIRRGSNR